MDKIKNILIIGANSDIAQELIKDSNYNFICLSSKDSNFDILNTNTFPIIKNLNGFVYFPGTINLKPFSNIKISEFEKDYNINNLGLINTLQFYLNEFTENSSFVFISSIAAKIGMKYHTSISMCKSAIEGLTVSLAAELSPKIRVNCISPSIIDTKLSSRILRNDKIKEDIIQKHPMKKIGSTKNIANAIEFLLSDKSEWITGQTINIDGGYSNLKN